ncbi:hypothetical protein SDC9_127682 [bioreactor metagenome]|uniref:Protein-serine/threonine phosphatase n=1 Tax=bioreactor metagenome TaxID=1076179 RepID=A0A645CVA1_9ZZZZ
MLDDNEIKEIVLSNKNQDIAKALVNAANLNGGTDNITVVAMFS